MTQHYAGRRIQAAFTLLEVLVALAIFAVTALALMKIAMNNTQSIQQNQLRTEAHFVAMNVAEEISIRGEWLTGIASEERSEQGERWKVTRTATATLSPDVQKIEIQVAYIDPDLQNIDNAQGITSLSVFNYRQAQQAGTTQ
ncbi:MAG: type II secretion system minor pseudopilin GspI [Acinetobacter populi]|jgi:general secretion pathway protein I|uniref:type II secretion system minor pseudopilin GspI n=1 Tax=Acinetobacter populi TaxID=1582270 RepID=UPI0023520100|nr:type II secretion system minor pseudopilin GspI [Acinetobacter populi]MCH4246537.1 type II secretion system minor pseudopilin GspI [Acinetobacter populi]